MLRRDRVWVEGSSAAARPYRDARRDGVAWGVAAPAFAAIKIAKIQYDSPGSDTGSNSSLDAEYVVIENTGNSRVNIDRWVLKDRAGHRYTFDSFRLRGGARLRCTRARGTTTGTTSTRTPAPTSGTTTGDTATLTDDNGHRRDRCRYSGGGTSVNC